MNNKWKSIEYEIQQMSWGYCQRQLGDQISYKVRCTSGELWDNVMTILFDVRDLSMLSLHEYVNNGYIGHRR